MAQQTRTTLKGYFETGEKPTQQQFADFIDSVFNLDDDGGARVKQMLELLLTTSRLVKNAVRGADFALNYRGTGDILDPSFYYSMGNILKGDFWVYYEDGMGGSSEYMNEGDWVMAMRDGLTTPFDFEDDGDWRIFSIGAGSSGGVTSVIASLPIQSTGGNTPVISIMAATQSAAGYMSAADKEKLDGIPQYAIDKIVDDITPQLGGDLDVNGKKFVSLSSADITIEPHGTGNTSIKSAKYTTSSGFDEVIANSSGTTTINWANGNHQKLTLSSNTILTFTAPPNMSELLLYIVHAANTTEYTITWPATVKWKGGVAPTITQTSNAVDIVRLVWNGTNYFANYESDFK